MRTPIEILVKAMHILANDIQSDDGVANAAIYEAAQRLEEQNQRIKRLEEQLMESKNKYAMLVSDVVLNEDMAERIKQLEAVTNDPHALWVNWLRGDVKLPVGIGDVRQYEDRIKRLEEAGNALLWYFCPKNTGDISFLQSEAIKQWNKAKEDKP